MMFWNKDLKSHLGATKKIKIYGIGFLIKKMNRLDYLDGSEGVMKFYDIYKVGKSVDPKSDNSKKIKKHFVDVFMSTVVEPELTRDRSDYTKIYAEDLLFDMELTNKLYQEIFDHTYGKKKQFGIFPKKRLLN